MYKLLDYRVIDPDLRPYTKKEGQFNCKNYIHITVHWNKS